MARPNARLAPARAPTRSRLPVDARRTQLLELGLELFADGTYDELSIDAIARAAGISKGLLYHYFPSKRDYYVETVRLAAARLVEAAALAPTGGPPGEALLRGLDAYLDFALRHAGAFRALMRGGGGISGDPEVLAIVDDTRAAILARIVGHLGLREDDALLRAALRGWIGAVEATSLDWLGRRDLDRAALVGLWARVFVASLAAAGVAVEGLPGLAEAT